MKIIKHSSRKTVVSYSRVFQYRGSEFFHGFSFPCDKDGKVKELNPCAQDSLEKCLSGEFDVIDQGVQEEKNSYFEPSVGLCECGEELPLGGFTNTCLCGADYNMSGQRLAPRSCWGEETGESYADLCVNEEEWY